MQRRLDDEARILAGRDRAGLRRPTRAEQRRQHAQLDELARQMYREATRDDVDLPF